MTSFNNSNRNDVMKNADALCRPLSFDCGRMVNSIATDSLKENIGQESNMEALASECSHHNFVCWIIQDCALLTGVRAGQSIYDRNGIFSAPLSSERPWSPRKSLSSEYWGLSPRNGCRLKLAHYLHLSLRLRDEPLYSLHSVAFRQTLPS
jgi:hypothetical protein